MPTPDEETKLEILTDHYKDTFACIHEDRKQRDRLFNFILAVITVMLFQVYSPKDAGDAIGQFLAKKLDLVKPLDISFIGSIIWFMLLGLVIRYFQTTVHLERQYEYIHQLEDEISPQYKGRAFTREGKSYLKNYPLFSNWTWILYTFAFPALLIIIVSSKIVHELLLATRISSLLVFNIAACISIVVSTVLSFLSVHVGK